MAAAFQVMICVGADGGGTKTDVVVVAPDGTVLGAHTAAGANHERIGFAASGRVLADALDAALAAAGRSRAEIAASAWALAGLDWPADEAGYRAQIAELALPGPTVVANDVAALLRAGLPGGAGVVVSAGTAMIAAGRAADGRVWRTLGMSSGPGDWGGGPEIVREAVNAIARAEMGFTSPTALTRIALTRTGRASGPPTWRTRCGAASGA